MAKDKDMIARRLATISSAPPVEIKGNTVTRKGKPKRAQRESVFRPAKIYTSKDAFVPCVVCNISNTGAYIRMEGAVSLPRTVILRLQQTGVAKKARVIWQDDQEAGLTFLADLTKKSPQAPNSTTAKVSR